MKESEYIIATNMVKITEARDILRKLYLGDQYGINEDKMREIINDLEDTIENLFEMVENIMKTGE